MPHESRQQKHLAYFQTSPVRAQLEPYQADSRPGWRYLQCTDTPNELKVLLPPRTSTLYARLLQLEAEELSNGQAANWERILEIRHLKDRMIRKCQRTSRFAVPMTSGASVQFRVVNAPPDFRLKEMERWLRAHDASNRITRDTLRRKPSLESGGAVTPSPRTSRAAPSVASVPRTDVRVSTPSKKRRSTASTQSAQSQVPTVPPKSPYQPSFLSPVPEEGTVGTPTPIHEHGLLPNPYPPAPVDSNFAPTDYHHIPRSQPNLAPASPYPPPVSHGSASPTYAAADARVPLVDLYTGSAPINAYTQPPANAYAQPPANAYIQPPANAYAQPELEPRADVVSPDPLPHPHRPPSGYIQPRQTYDELHDAAMHAPAIGMLPQDVGMPHPVTHMPEPAIAQQAPPLEELPHHPPARVESVEDIESGRPPIPRRRSGLRSNRNSFSGGKVVSWAMDRDWSEHMTKFDHIVYSAEVAGEELHRAREQFKSDMRGVKGMRENISASLERLRLETERLQLEERALKEHEDMMSASLERLQEREMAYKDKVKAVLDGSMRVVIAADGKRDVVLG